jgi:hypothetical protein
VSTLSPFDWEVRQYVYEFFVENERPPQAAEGATAFKVPAEQIQTAYRTRPKYPGNSEFPGYLLYFLTFNAESNGG